MQSPYAAMFDQAGGLNPEDMRGIGLATAMLIIFWPQWLHRRVELVTIEDHDVIRRSNSFDFTVPHQVYDLLSVDGTQPVRTAVPLTFVRKGELVHLKLTSEGSDAVPLLSTPQLSALSEAALIATAETALGGKIVPPTIICDIRRLVRDAAKENPQTSRYIGPAIEARDRLFSEHEPEAEIRKLLRSHSVFASLAYAFSIQFLAAVMLPITAHERRIVHLAYDERFYDSDGLFRRLRILFALVAGNRARRILISAPHANESASYHLEAEAPEGLQISWGKAYFLRTDIPPEEKTGTYQRIHFHYERLTRGTRLSIALWLRPRSSTIVRGATLTAALTLLGVSYVLLQFGEITSIHGAQSAAAALLVVPLLLSLYLVRTDEHPMTTQLLWPLRIIATAPGVLSLMAAGVLVGNLSQRLSEWILRGIVALLVLSTAILAQTWFQTARQERRRNSRVTDSL
jgi:hypothetical protein